MRSQVYQMYHGDYRENIAILLILIRENHEFMMTEKGYRLFSDGMRILKQDAPRTYQTLTKLFSEGEER